MLRNGLGEVLERELIGAKRFVDLFTGSSAVAVHVACNFDIPVLASDLQSYSVVLANAVLHRQRAISAKRIWFAWHKRALAKVIQTERVPRLSQKLTRAEVKSYRNWCASKRSLPITAAYGGHYFSPRQAVWIDALRMTLPTRGISRQVALAALIQAASFCVAGPGHTAQPFQPTRTAKRFLNEAWCKDIAQKTKQRLESLSSIIANKRGNAVVGDANLVAKRIEKSDLVFIDPPYTGVHYSRFYHVLESIAQGNCGEVYGVGRYPSDRKRPRSRYSLQTESKSALDQLLKTIAKRGAKVILTFPNHKCSNGLSGYYVKKIAARYFSVQNMSVASRFSSLGGTSDGERNQAGRAARRDARELVLTLKVSPEARPAHSRKPQPSLHSRTSYGGENAQ